MAVRGDKGDITSIDIMIADSKKYILAVLINYNIMAFGKKFHQVYLEVSISLLQYLNYLFLSLSCIYT